MTWRRYLLFLLYILALLLPVDLACAQSAEPLPSWNDGAAKTAIIDFVGRVTKEGGADFVPPEERVAAFDNDGTLWCEMPMYVQLVFAIDRVHTLAPQHPEWKDQEPFKSILAGDLKAAVADGPRAMNELIAATHAGMTVDEFDKIIRDWIAKAEHPRFHRPYTELIYQPMVEVLQYLRANGFKTFIVSGGGQEFMRPWTERAYGIPPEQVIGSQIELNYELRDGQPVLMRLPKITLIDDKVGKPVGISRGIGRQPIIAFGNSDGDLEMLQWTTMTKPSEPGRPRPRLGLIVHHTDAEREYAYDRNSFVGRLDKAWDQAAERGWILIDMKHDWRDIFPPQK